MNLLEKKQQSGQILAILAITLVGLLGFLAIAIDGGMIYSDRRYDQNAADASALAAASEVAIGMENANINYQDFDCSDAALSPIMQNGHTVAKQRALSNNFTIEDNLDNHHGVNLRCVYEDLESHYLKGIEITVEISSDVQTSFAHLFYNKPIINQVKAVTLVKPRVSPGYGYALVSLSENCDSGSGMTFTGTSGIDIFGGGIFSHSCITASGGGEVTVHDLEEGINLLGTYTQNGGSVVSPTPQQLTVSPPPIYIPEPDCSYYPISKGNYVINSNATLEPGRYDKIKVNAGADVLMKPGLYCIEGEFTVLGGIVHIDDALGGVTIDLIGGDFSAGGNVSIFLKAPTGTLEEVYPAKPGLLFYMPESNAGKIHMSGTSASDYTGTVYAPSGTIEAGGTSDSPDPDSVMGVIHTQMIGYNVVLEGTTSVAINFQTSENFTLPAYIDMYE
jgi:Flp pilus assembly protein TadG